MAPKNLGNLGLGKVFLGMLRARSRLARLRQDPEADDAEIPSVEVKAIGGAHDPL